MKLIDLYLRVLGTTGLDVMDLNSLHAAVSNCMADLTSRGYKIFKELHLNDFSTKKLTLKEIENPSTKQIANAYEYNEDDKYKEDEIIHYNEKYYRVVVESTFSGESYDNLVILPAPKDIRKVVFLRLFFNQDATLATRMSLSNPRVQCKYENGQFRSWLEENQAIYYIKNDKIYIEWHTSLRPTLEEISFGYYQKLYCPEDFPTDASDADKMKQIEIDIRPEFEDALVFYATYFYTARYIRDTDKVNLALSNYKYYVEDIIHELSYEDEFNEEDAVIKIEED